MTFQLTSTSWASRKSVLPPLATLCCAQEGSPNIRGLWQPADSNFLFLFHVGCRLTAALVLALALCAPGHRSGPSVVRVIFMVEGRAREEIRVSSGS